MIKHFWACEAVALEAHIASRKGLPALATKLRAAASVLTAQPVVSFYAVRGSEVYEPSLLSKQKADPIVAVVRISGVMVKSFGAWDWIYEEFFGVKSTSSLAAEIRELSADEGVTGIVLHIDSPGGQVDGTETLAKAVAECAKPVVAYADGQCCSAALWVAAQAVHIKASEAATTVGSIGALYRHESMVGYLEQKGLEVTYITSEGAERKALGNEAEILSPEAKIYMTNFLSRIKAKFDNAVRTGRAASGAKVKADAFDGSAFDAEQAVALGLIDSIGDMDEAISMAAELGEKNKAGASAVARGSVLAAAKARKAKKAEDDEDDASAEDDEYAEDDEDAPMQKKRAKRKAKKAKDDEDDEYAEDDEEKNAAALVQDIVSAVAAQQKQILALTKTLDALVSALDVTALEPCTTVPTAGDLNGTPGRKMLKIEERILAEREEHHPALERIFNSLGKK